MVPPILINTNCGLTAIEQVRCPQCGGVVYAAESVKCMGHAWHRSCFKCQVCRRALSIGSYVGHSNLPYCRVHYPKDRPNLHVEGLPEHTRMRHVGGHTGTQYYNQHDYHGMHQQEMIGKKFSVMAEPASNRAKMTNFVPNGQDQVLGNCCPQCCQNESSLPKTKQRHQFSSPPGGDCDEHCNCYTAPKVNISTRESYPLRQPMANQWGSSNRVPKSYGHHGNGVRQNNHTPQQCCETYPKRPMENHISGKPGRNYKSCSCDCGPKCYRMDDVISGQRRGDTHSQSYNMCPGGGIIEDNSSETCSCQGSIYSQPQNYDRRPTTPVDCTSGRGYNTRMVRSDPVDLARNRGMGHSLQNPPLRAENFRANMRSHHGF